ncbi:MAG: potassium uptake protein, TrkH family, partial [Clostridia bacterium]|nr:potassium uptake protein, TrkH family [Clostridia bacterium]
MLFCVKNRFLYYGGLILVRDIFFWLRSHLVRKRGSNAVRIVVAGFAAIILLGGLLLTLPIASRDGQSVGLMTGLFTATSATCVTGLIMVDTWSHWTLFGQIVILCLIQIGGLGFMTVLALVSFVLHRRISLSERLIMVSSLNLNDMDGVVRVVRHALYGTFIIEGSAALILMTRFIPQFGFLGGVWRGVFHAISGFCNAGFDLMGGYSGEFSSLTAYTRDPVVLITIMALITVGGLGFFVWEDIWAKRSFRKLSLYSKLVLCITGFLI